MATHAVLNLHPSLRRAERARVLITACCGVFVSFASIVVYTFGVFLKPLAGAFHWSRTEVSAAFTLAALTVALCSPLIGYLLDHFPARRVVLPCTIVYGAAFGSMAWLTPHLWHLYALFVILGIVGNGTTQLAYARIVSAWFDEHRGQALAAVIAGTGLGSVVFPPGAQALISRYGWRAAYAVLGALILVAAVPLATAFLYEPQGTATLARSAIREQRAAATVLSTPFWGILAALLLFSFATNGLNTHWAALLTDGGATPGQAALILSIAGSAVLFGKLGTGFLLDRFRAGRVAAVLLALCAAGFVFTLRAYSWPFAVGSAILVGIGMGAESDVTPYLLTRYFGLSRFGVLYGYTWCVYALAGATGPVVMGAVFDRTRSYHPALVVSMAMVVTASVIFGVLPRYPSSASPGQVGAAPAGQVILPSTTDPKC
ncbi:MAG TPA: MFS transporter [Bryobacteraceae bacterium]|nr:MFS transporter [Bryobacteraceae bacterium]